MIICIIFFTAWIVWADDNVTDLQTGTPVTDICDRQNDVYQRHYFRFEATDDIPLLSISADTSSELALYVRKSDFPHETAYDYLVSEHPYSLLINDVQKGDTWLIWVKGYCEEMTIKAEVVDVRQVRVGHPVDMNLYANEEHIYYLKPLRSYELLKISLTQSNADLYVNRDLPSNTNSLPKEKDEHTSWVYVLNASVDDTFMIVVQARTQAVQAEFQIQEISLGEIAQELDDGEQIEWDQQEEISIFKFTAVDPYLYLRLQTPSWQSEVQAYISKDRIANTDSYDEHTTKGSSVTYSNSNIELGDYYITVYNPSRAHFSILCDSYSLPVTFIQDSFPISQSMAPGIDKILIMEIPPGRDLDIILRVDVLIGEVDVLAKFCDTNFDYCEFMDFELENILDADISFARHISGSRWITLETNSMECAESPCWVSVMLRTHEETSLKIEGFTNNFIHNREMDGVIKLKEDSLIKYEVTDYFISSISFGLDSEEIGLTFCVSREEIITSTCDEMTFHGSYGELRGLYYIEVYYEDGSAEEVNFTLTAEKTPLEPEDPVLHHAQMHFDFSTAFEPVQKFTLPVQGSNELNFPISVSLIPINGTFRTCLIPPGAPAESIDDGIWCTEEMNEYTEYSLEILQSDPDYKTHGEYVLFVQAISFIDTTQAVFILQCFSGTDRIVLEDGQGIVVTDSGSLEFPSKAGDDVWLTMSGDPNSLEIQYQNDENQPVTLKDLRSFDNTIYIPNELLESTGDLSLTLVNLNCTQCSIRAHSNTRDVMSQITKASNEAQGQLPLQFYTLTLEQEDTINIFRDEGATNSTQVWIQATPWSDVALPLIITAKSRPSFECEEPMCEVYSSKEKQIVSLAIYGQQYKISRSGTEPIEGVGIIEDGETKSTTEWLSQFVNDYQQYLIIGGAIVGGLLALIVVATCCKKMMTKEDGYGSLDPEESSLDVSAAIN